MQIVYVSGAPLGLPGGIYDILDEDGNYISGGYESRQDAEQAVADLEQFGWGDIQRRN